MGRQLALKLWVSRFSAKASQTAGVEFEEMPLSPMLRPDPMPFFSKKIASISLIYRRCREGPNPRSFLFLNLPSVKRLYSARNHRRPPTFFRSLLRILWWHLPTLNPLPHGHGFLFALDRISDARKTSSSAACGELTAKIDM